MNGKTLFLLIGLVVSTSAIIACEYFPESTFDLASESRLPKWVAVPDGLTRADIAITMNYYVKPWGGTATFIVRDLKRKTETKMSGTIRDSAPSQLKHPPPGFPTGYPAYEVVTVNGITEIIEHRKPEPRFYVTDDPGVWKELGVAQK